MDSLTRLERGPRLANFLPPLLLMSLLRPSAPHSTTPSGKLSPPCRMYACPCLLHPPLLIVHSIICPSPPGYLLLLLYLIFKILFLARSMNYLLRLMMMYVSHMCADIPRS